eukprot:1065031-Rhodomonas_salina.1
MLPVCKLHWHPNISNACGASLNAIVLSCPGFWPGSANSSVSVSSHSTPPPLHVAVLPPSSPYVGQRGGEPERDIHEKELEARKDEEGWE